MAARKKAVGGRGGEGSTPQSTRSRNRSSKGSKSGSRVDGRNVKTGSLEEHSTATSPEEIAVAAEAVAEIERMREKMKVPVSPESDQLLKTVVIVQYMLPMVLIVLWAMWKGKLSITYGVGGIIGSAVLLKAALALGMPTEVLAGVG